MLRKRAEAAELAVVEFKAANRDDLIEKELLQLGVLEGYINSVEMVGEEEITAVIAETMDRRREDGLPVSKTSLLKALNRDTGAFGGKIVDMGKVAQIAEDMVKDARNPF